MLTRSRQQADGEAKQSVRRTRPTGQSVYQRVNNALYIYGYRDISKRTDIAISPDLPKQYSVVA